MKEMAVMKGLVMLNDFELLFNYKNHSGCQWKICSWNC